MDKADQLQFKISIYIQLTVIAAYFIVIMVNIIDLYIIQKHIDSYVYFFPSLILFFALSFYISFKKDRETGRQLFYIIVASALLLNVLIGDQKFVNSEIAYIIPIILTILDKDLRFAVLYSFVIIFIYIIDKAIYSRLLETTTIINIIIVILSISIILICNYWLKEINKLRLDSISENYTSTLRILGRVAELKDEETHEHLERVSIIIEKITKRLKRRPQYSDYLKEKYIEDLKAASSLHDIGKIAISDNILLKPGKLSSDEYDKMKMHTVFGSELLEEAQLKTNNHLYSLAIELARHHHERWDGTGYPDKLKGNNIPLSARIMAIADVYDALVSKRPYKRPYSDKEAYIIIVSESGTQFDPDIVRCFMKMHKKIYESIMHLL